MTTGPGVNLGPLTWPEAEAWLTEDRVVVLPVGAAAKEHGPHLPLENDKNLAEALAERVRARLPVVVAPVVGYHHYPAFGAYPGSTTLRPETARDLVVDICRSLSRYGPRRFYALNTGLSTKRPLAAAAAALADDGVRLTFTDLKGALAPAEEALLEQERGSHADETETSMMLALAPDTVRLDRAVKDASPRTPGEPFTRIQGAPGTYSPTGTWGDPTLATVEKGERLVAALVDRLCADIEALQTE